MGEDPQRPWLEGLAIRCGIRITDRDHRERYYEPLATLERFDIPSAYRDPARRIPFKYARLVALLYTNVSEAGLDFVADNAQVDEFAVEAVLSLLERDVLVDMSTSDYDKLEAALRDVIDAIDSGEAFDVWMERFIDATMTTFS